LSSFSFHLSSFSRPTFLISYFIFIGNIKIRYRFLDCRRPRALVPRARPSHRRLAPPGLDRAHEGPQGRGQDLVLFKFVSQP
jgi:hypothetical protein